MTSGEIGNLHFLVVEDQDFQRAALVHLLTGLGARHVVEAGDGAAAMEVLQARMPPVDIVITDLDMPGMDGMEFIRRIAEARLPVSMVLSSAHDRALLASVATMTQAYGVMLLGTVEKPVGAARLASLVSLYQPPRPLRPGAARPRFSDEDISAALMARQFDAYFQPKIEVASGRLAGAEALARWRHPERGIVGPYAFVPALEANKCIDDLTWIMLEQAAVACRAWRAQGLDMSVSVNLSLASLTSVGLAERITGLVTAQGLEPRHVILEVTETIAMTDIAPALENLARLRIRGFGLSIDDYGTGYSSMQQLERIPFTELKIDQSFVMSAIEKDSCRAILESSLDIARRLGLKAVAEGVETRADWELLRSLGCQFAQGYMIAKPMDAATMVDWARDWKGAAL